MRLAGWLTAMLLLLLTAGAVALWIVQNADQTVTLRLDLGALVGAWQAEPLSAPVLVAGAFGVGALVVGLPAAAWGLAQRGRARALERELELTSERR